MPPQGQSAPELASRARRLNPIVGYLGLGLTLASLDVTRDFSGLVRERGQEDCPVGRAARSILIFQDIAAILLLITAGALPVPSLTHDQPRVLKTAA